MSSLPETENPPSGPPPSTEAGSALPENTEKSEISKSSTAACSSEAPPPTTNKEKKKLRNSGFKRFAVLMGEEPKYENEDSDGYWYTDDDSESDHHHNDSDSDDGMTEEQAKQYSDAVRASEGFDVPSFPGVSVYCCTIVPCTLTEERRDELKPFCVAAIKDFNEKNEANYEFVELVKANKRGCGYTSYYLTFKAGNGNGNCNGNSNSQTFQALVLEDWFPKDGEDPITVEFCRLHSLN